MNRVDHLLWNLAEECAEVAQRASKAARFGLAEVQEGQPYNNAERIMHEFADLMGVMDLLIEEGILEYPNNFEELVSRKVLRFDTYLRISMAQGRLDKETQ